MPKGSGVKGGFTCGANLLTLKYEGRFGDAFTKDKLKNKFKTLKKTYGIVKPMLDLSGFGWVTTKEKWSVLNIRFLFLNEH